ncbi:hypothetical protein ARSEF1564_003395 [Beauveria bassiana]
MNPPPLPMAGHFAHCTDVAFNKPAEALPTARARKSPEPDASTGPEPHRTHNNDGKLVHTIARPQPTSQAVESKLHVAVHVTLQNLCAALHVSHVTEEPATSAGVQFRFWALGTCSSSPHCGKDMGRRGRLAAPYTVNQTLATKNGTSKLYSGRNPSISASQT